jgi:Zn-dependent peptidase ImmA (M78 family)
VSTSSIVFQLRDLVPPRPLTPSELRQVIERQATRLLALCEIQGPPVPITDIIFQLPGVEMQRRTPLPMSGLTEWVGDRWLITIAADEAAQRQRATLAHELAHVIWHPLIETSLPPTDRQTTEQRLERACDYFAASLLMPRVWMKRAYCEEGIQTIGELSRLFGTSYTSILRRLEELGLVPRAEYNRAKGLVIPLQPRLDLGVAA